MAPMLTSCIYDDIEADVDGGDMLSAMPRIALNISPVSLGPVNADVTEMIGSLRVIIVSEVTDKVTDETTGEVTETKTSYVEYNEYFDFTGKQGGDMFSGPGEAANTFRYIITRNTVPGLKKLYLIANENMVSPINFQDVETFPKGVANNMKLHDFLNLYKADYIPNLAYPDPETVPAEGEPKGAEFEQLVNAIYYTPEFKQTDLELSTGSRKVIFLPYTSHYEYALASKADIESGQANGAVNILDATAYLVPCATKFRFQFQNYRENSVVINSLELSGMATDMYLFAQVYGDDLNKKKFGAQSNLWWVDWLAQVSAASQNVWDPEDNMAFNSSYGWINLYNVPTSAIEYDPDLTDQDNATENGIVELIPDDTPWNVGGRAPNSNPVTGTPGTFETGYFYFPESRYMVKFPVYNENGDQVGNQMRQAYYLTLDMLGGEMGGQPTVKSTQIANLGSMFRNTKAYITIRLRDAGDVGAYAELQPWDESHTNGTVLEEPSNE